MLWGLDCARVRLQAPSSLLVVFSNLVLVVGLCLVLLFVWRLLEKRQSKAPEFAHMDLSGTPLEAKPEDERTRPLIGAESARRHVDLAVEFDGQQLSTRTQRIEQPTVDRCLQAVAREEALFPDWASNTSAALQRRPEQFFIGMDMTDGGETHVVRRRSSGSGDSCDPDTAADLSFADAHSEKSDCARVPIATDSYDGVELANGVPECGYLAVSAGDRIEVLHSKPQFGHRYNRHQSYTFCRRCDAAVYDADATCGWIPTELITVTSVGDRHIRR